MLCKYFSHDSTEFCELMRSQNRSKCDYVKDGPAPAPCWRGELPPPARELKSICPECSHCRVEIGQGRAAICTKGLGNAATVTVWCRSFNKIHPASIPVGEENEAFQFENCYEDDMKALGARVCKNMRPDGCALFVRPATCPGNDALCPDYEVEATTTLVEADPDVITTADSYASADAVFAGMFATEADPDGIKAGEPGAKLDAGKLKASLLMQFSRALTAVAEISTFGANKYSRGGWQHVKDGVERYGDAEWRHLLAIGRGEQLDNDSGLPHKWHRAWNVLATLERELRESETEKTPMD